MPPCETVLLAAGRQDQPLADVWAALLRTAHRTGMGGWDTAVPEPGDAPAAVPRALKVEGFRRAAILARSLLQAGHGQLLVVLLPRPGEAGCASSAEGLADAISTLRKQYPGARIHDVGRTVDPETASALAELVAVPRGASEALLAGVITRGFDGDPARLARFVTVLRGALPEDTTIAMRGSTVMGHAFRDGAPYDADGPGSSDLDLVVMGEAASDLWVPEARLLGGINTLPLGDDAPWVAPELDGPRREAQAVVGRPLSIQAMARWFLDLRVALQAQQYVVLAGPP